MKFIADGMLGKLTRWLRMLGYDIKYTSNLDDKTLMEIAITEKRVLLTRDVELCQRAASQNAKAFLVEGKNEAERLATLSKQFDLKLELKPEESRCPVCNTKIIPVRKNEVAAKIFSSTKTFYEDFWKCTVCGKVYWQGAHWKMINETLKRARKILMNLK